MAFIWGTGKIRSVDLLSGAVVAGALGSGAVVSGSLGSNVVLSGQVGSGAVFAAVLFTRYGYNYSAAAQSVTISHNLGVQPAFVVVTGVSGANRGTVNASQLVVNVAVSGTAFDWAVFG